MRAIAVLATLAVLLAAAPIASAGPEIPPEKLPSCGDVFGDAKCEQIHREVRDLLLCTCPPL